MEYAVAKVAKINLDNAHKLASEALKLVSGDERSLMGLTPDHIKAKPEWQEAYRNERAAFKAMRDFNMKFSKVFKKEMRADPDFNFRLRAA